MTSFNKKKYPLGVDISNNFLKIAQLQVNRNKIMIQGLGETPLKEGVIKDGVIIDKKSLVDSIKNLISNPNFGNFNTDEVVVGLPEEKTYIKLIKVEKSLNQISDIIGSEIEKHIPISAGETYYDWQLIKSSEEVHSILIGAAPKPVVEQYIDFLKSANLSINALEIESMPIARALLRDENPQNPSTEKSKNYALINIGETKSSITIYCQKTIVLSMSIPLSSNNISKKIAEALSISQSQAQKAKIVCGFDPKNAEGIIREILLKHFEELTKHINKIIKFYTDNHQDLGDLNEIIICGEGSKIKDVEKLINKETGYRTSIGDPLVNIEKNSNKLLDFFESNNDKKQKSIASYSTAIGLALRNILADKQ